MDETGYSNAERHASPSQNGLKQQSAARGAIGR